MTGIESTAPPQKYGVNGFVFPLDWEDFSPTEMIEKACSELQNVHDELARVTRLHDGLVASTTDALATITPSDAEVKAARKARVEIARRRFRQRQIGPLALIRVLTWIYLKGGHQDALAARLELARASLPLDKVASNYLGDKPVRYAMGGSDYEKASVWAKALGIKHGRSPNFLELTRQLAVKRGNVSQVLELTHKIEGLKKQKSPGAIRQVEGRVREASGWLPRIPGPKTPIVPRDQVTIMHLVKESRPFHSNGFTSRSQRNFESELAAGLRPVVVTELGFPRSVVGDDFNLIELVEGIEHHRLDVGPGYKVPAFDEWLTDFAWAAYKKLCEIRPAVIHVSSGRRGYETALVGLALKEKTGLPLVYEVRSFFEGTWTGETAQEDKSEIFARRMAVEQMCMERADFVLTIGEAMRDEITSRGIPASKIAIVPNGVDLENFQPQPRSAELASKYGLKGPTFGYVSNMDHPRESQETLIRAAAILRGRGLDFTCVLVGSGLRFEEMKAFAKKYKAENAVVFTGSVDHNSVAGHYSLIDIFVVPRILERASKYVTPLKPFEAMALERPIIGSDLPALREILSPPLRGEVFTTGDAKDLADKIQLLAKDPARMKALGRAGRAWVESDRQWSNNGVIYREVFQSVQQAWKVDGN
ncbi:glycosyltransferase family 4 protein [Paenarthrobacter ilicis]|uniref:glycosyltransferase family 4 protein n=1 Tax=Paenarthrobacter ilicis TaxID=43665 RepID=UPI0028D7B9AC|nr:glycosyltransferase family 4 protein [Paenarthrobacter ilicis]